MSNDDSDAYPVSVPPRTGQACTLLSCLGQGVGATGGLPPTHTLSPQVFTEDFEVRDRKSVV